MPVCVCVCVRARARVCVCARALQKRQSGWCLDGVGVLARRSVWAPQECCGVVVVAVVVVVYLAHRLAPEMQHMYGNDSTPWRSRMSFLGPCWVLVFLGSGLPE